MPWTNKNYQRKFYHLVSLCSQQAVGMFWGQTNVSERIFDPPQIVVSCCYGSPTFQLLGSILPSKDKRLECENWTECNLQFQLDSIFLSVSSCSDSEVGTCTMLWTWRAVNVFSAAAASKNENEHDSCIYVVLTSFPMNEERLASSFY